MAAEYINIPDEYGVPIPYYEVTEDFLGNTMTDDIVAENLNMFTKVDGSYYTRDWGTEANVKDVGFVTNGSADQQRWQTNALNQLVNSLTQRIYFPTGYYYFKGSVVIINSYSVTPTFYGEGVDSMLNQATDLVAGEYVHLKWADDESGSNMSNLPKDSNGNFYPYIGILNNNSQVISESAGDYSWFPYDSTAYGTFFYRYSYVHLGFASDASGTDMQPSPYDASGNLMPFAGLLADESSAAPSTITNYVWTAFSADALLSCNKRSFLEVNVGKGNAQYNGFRLEHLHFHGRGYIGSGIHIFNGAQVNWNDITIEQFIGHALWLDKVQDSWFNHCNIQASGATLILPDGTSDPTVNANTVGFPVWLTSTISGDACNMVRFTNCEIEQNNVSPFVAVDSGGIGLTFLDTHAEIRNSEEYGTKDWMQNNGADIEIRGHKGQQFRNGLVTTGYGTVNIIGGRNIDSILYSGVSGKSGRIIIKDTTIGDFSVGGYGGMVSISGTVMNNLLISYPGALINWMGASVSIHDCSIKGNVDISYVNLTSSIVNVALSNLYIEGDYNVVDGKHVNLTRSLIRGNVSVDNNSYGASITESVILGDNSFLADAGHFIANSVSGTDSSLSSNYAGSSYSKVTQGIRFDTTTHIYTNSVAGSLTINSAPANYQPMGWVKTGTGNNYLALPTIGLTLAEGAWTIATGGNISAANGTFSKIAKQVALSGSITTTSAVTNHALTLPYTPDYGFTYTDGVNTITATGGSNTAVVTIPAASTFSFQLNYKTA